MAVSSVKRYNNLQREKMSGKTKVGNPKWELRVGTIRWLTGSMVFVCNRQDVVLQQLDLEFVRAATWNLDADARARLSASNISLEDEIFISCWWNPHYTRSD